MTDTRAQDALESLAAKLNGLELTDDESVVLENLIIGHGEEAEVAGFDFGLSNEGGVQMLGYKLDRCWVKSWSTSGDADDRPTEEVAFYYNRIP